MIFTAILLALLTAFTVYHVYIIKKRRAYSHLASPPIPISLFWHLGHWILFKEKSATCGFNLTAIFESFRKDCGGSDTIALFFGPKFKAVVFTVRTSINSKVLSDHHTYLKRTPEDSLVDFVHCQRFLGSKNILLDQGTEIWHKKRRIMDPAFQKKFLRQLMVKMTHTANQLCLHLAGKSDQKEIDIFPILTRTALEVVCSCGFNLFDDFIAKEDSKMNTAINKLFEVSKVYVFNSQMFALPWKFRDEKATFKREVEFLRNSMKDHLKQRFETISQNEDKTNDLLSFIVKGNTFSDELTMEDLVDDFLVFLMAGTETTANTLSCLVWEILKHPAISQRIHEEIRCVLGSKDNLEFDDLTKLVYMEQCIKETLRIHSPVMGTFRVSPDNPTTIDGLLLPPNTEIFISIEEAHMSELHWSDPMTFDPDRFGHDRAREIKQFTYMPFVAGPRACMGKHFAIMEMKVLLAKLFNDVNITDARPEEKVLEKKIDLVVKPIGVFIGVSE